MSYQEWHQIKGRQSPIVIMAIQNYWTICVIPFVSGVFVSLVLLALYNLAISNNWILFTLMLSDIIVCILLGVYLNELLLELEDPAPQLQLQLPFYLIDRQHG